MDVTRVLASVLLAQYTLGARGPGDSKIIADLVQDHTAQRAAMITATAAATMVADARITNAGEKRMTAPIFGRGGRRRGGG